MGLASAARRLHLSVTEARAAGVDVLEVKHYRGLLDTSRPIERRRLPEAVASALANGRIRSLGSKLIRLVGRWPFRFPLPDREAS